ncbi:MAG: hypothetical protein A2Z99_20735 [Treponema sp. GWB1_62_6]|nr:MAG: hypothetical protein A2Z99_20735 [Treponema sp. GWB1_62_6]OHE68961.1 MAG: hypothetical protein A2001_06605 [Treponema sp. GWC1_61_84]
MIKAHLAVIDDLKNYASPKARLTRMLKAGTLVKVRRGLFVDDAPQSRRTLAPVIYGSSYISFQYALAVYGLIPERVQVVTSASFNKNRDKLFRTPLGEYRYLYLPVSVYPHGLHLEEEDGASYLIASAEKALCDTVYKAPKITAVDEMEPFLLDDMRMEKESLRALDHEFIDWIAPMYRRKSLLALAAWFRKEDGK